MAGSRMSSSSPSLITRLDRTIVSTNVFSAKGESECSRPPTTTVTNETNPVTIIMTPPPPHRPSCDNVDVNIATICKRFFFFFLARNCLSGFSQG